MELIAAAERAEEYADALKRFKDPVPNSARDITALVAELYHIGHALRDLDSSIRSPELRRNYIFIENDLALVRESLDWSLDDIFRMLGRLANGSPHVTPSEYAMLWREIDLFFTAESRLSLITRFNLYRTFLEGLGSIVKRSPPRPGVMGGLRRDLDVLLIEQTPPHRLTDQVGSMSLGPTGRPERRSFERPRPPGSPQSPMSPNAGTPPWAPEVSEASTATSTYSSSVSDSGDAHWARSIFQNISATPLKNDGASSKCYGEPNSDAKFRLAEEYNLLFALVFPKGLEVGLYIRDSDKRARILCKGPRSDSRGSRYYCLPLNTLVFRRQGSTLQLCRRIKDRSKVELWAILKFSTIERLVVFFCALVALRSQDAGRVIQDLKDKELAQEEEYFGGRIDDDGYSHALRVFRDSPSKAVRIQASILDGEMKDAPVWTAFIHHQLTSPSWASKAGSRTIYLRDLRRHVFSSQYTPQTNTRGEHVLKFTTAKDATDFIETLRDLAQMPSV